MWILEQEIKSFSLGESFTAKHSAVGYLRNQCRTFFVFKSNENGSKFEKNRLFEKFSNQQ